MFDKLAAVERRYEELVQRLGSAELQSDPSEYRKQAKALVEQLGSFDPVVIVSSPYLRCLQTVKPLARSLGIEDYRMTPGLNDSPFFIQALAGLVRRAVQHDGVANALSNHASS